MERVPLVRFEYAGRIFFRMTSGGEFIKRMLYDRGDKTVVEWTVRISTQLARAICSRIYNKCIYTSFET